MRGIRLMKKSFPGFDVRIKAYRYFFIPWNASFLRKAVESIILGIA